MPIWIPGDWERVFGTKLNQGCFFISVIEILLSGSVVKILLMRSAADSETWSGNS